MAVAVTSGGSDTDSPVADEKRVDMQDKFKMLDPDQTQFYSAASHVATRPATREKFNWLEDQYFPNKTTSNGGANNSTTTIPVATGTGVYFRVGDIVNVSRTGEKMEVTVSSGSDSPTMNRGIGTTIGTTINDGDDLHIIGNVSAQFADVGTMKVTTRVLGYNYPQTQRHPFGFGGQALQIDTYGPGEPANEMAKKSVEHKRALENTMWTGGRKYTSASPNSKGYAGGFTEFVTTNVFTSIGTLTRAVLDAKLTTIYQHGSTNKAIFCAPVVAGALSGLFADNWVRSTQGETVYGAKVNAYIIGAYGDKVPVYVKKEWGVFSTASNQQGSWAAVVDMNYIANRVVRNRGTAILPERQGNGIDGKIWEWMTDQGLELSVESAHGLLKGITG